MKQETKKFKFSLKVNNEEYVSEGATVFDAYDGLDLPTQMFKTRGELTLTTGGKSASMVVYQTQMRRAFGKFANKIFREIFITKLQTLLK